MQFEALRQQLKATAADLGARCRELGCVVTSAAVSPTKPAVDQPPGRRPQLRSYSVRGPPHSRQPIPPAAFAEACCAHIYGRGSVLCVKPWIEVECRVPQPE